MLTFNSIDVETANVDRATICQIGIVHVCDGEVTDQWQTFVNPEDWFDPWNVSIHRIDKKTVKRSPPFHEIADELRARVHGSILVSHTSFDRVACERAMTRYNLDHLEVTWLDSARIVRRAWPERYGRKDYGLKNVANDLGFLFRHHNALEDARAAAEVVLKACAATGTDIEGWLRRVSEPIFPRASGPVQQSSQSSVTSSLKREGNIEGVHYGETIVFTGKLGITQNEAADLAANAGFDVANNITNKVTMLVIGIQDKARLKGYDKSSKHRKVVSMIQQGMDIQILSENDFLDLIGIG